jgi:phage tail sheath protein FI
MPEYLSPGVYIEETSFRAKTIEGVSTSTAAFIGSAAFGPVLLEPDLVTSIGEFERVYGGGRRLDFEGVVLDNHLWHGARAYFAEGGRRLYVSRIFLRSDTDLTDPTRKRDYAGPDATPTLAQGRWTDGHARAWVDLGSPVDHDDSIAIRARYPGSGGNARVRLILHAGKSVFSQSNGTNRVQNVLDGDVVAVLQTGQDPVRSPIDQPLYRAVRASDGSWSFVAGSTSLALASLPADSLVHVLSLSVGVTLPDDFEQVWDGLALHPGHLRDGAEDSFTARFREDTAQPTLNRSLPVVFDALGAMGDGVAIAEAILGGSARFTLSLIEIRDRRPVLPQDYIEVLERHGVLEILLAGGNDGAQPAPDVYEGRAESAASYKTGLKQLEDIEDVSIVAAPGSSYSAAPGSTDNARAVAGLLIAHAEQMRYRIAVLDSVNGHVIGDVRDYRAKLDSKYAALYYPWVRVLDPITRQQIVLPPSGFVAGIYARNDIERAVYKAPANEVVRLALGFELTLNKGQQDVLNPEGINCFRYFEGRGNRIWGARTISSDPEWKYVNLRRYFAYLERSIDRGTQWAVFEPNGERLWANARRTIEDFLTNEFQNGALLGTRPEQAFFVKCDRSTMTQNDLDNGRLVCLIGVAPLRPAEFVIFRIGQWTGDRRS